MDKKSLFGKINFYIFQHLSFVFASVCLVVLLLNSFLSFEYMSGNQTYSNMYFINPFMSSGNFENSEVFNEMLDKSIEEIVRYAVIKGQLEEDGQYNGKKVINIVSYANRKNRVSGTQHQSLMANYYLEDLIKWGRYKESYEEVYFDSMWGAVSYFDQNVLDDYYYVIDLSKKDDFHLSYDGNQFYYIDPNGLYIPVYKGAAIGCTQQFQDLNEYYNPEYDKNLDDNMTINTSPSIMDIVVSTAYYYEIGINAYSSEYVLESDDTVPGVVVNMLKERYQTIENSNLVSLSSCWKDYFALSENMVYSIDALFYNYNLYQVFKKEYDNSNLEFCLSMIVNGEKVLLGNIQLQADKSIQGLDEYFINNYDKYIIYSNGEMYYSSNTQIKEQQIFEELSHYEYAYPENTRFWLGVTTSNFHVNDKFAKASVVFDDFMPKAWYFMIEVLLGYLCWLIGTIYVCCTIGKSNQDEKDRQIKLVWFDKIPFEIEIVLFAIISFIYFIIICFNLQIVEDIFLQIIEKKPLWIYINVTIQALILSLLITSFFYSFARRFWVKNMWEGSISRRLWLISRKSLKSIFYNIKKFMILTYDNGKAFIRIVFPFLIVIGINIASGALLYKHLNTSEKINYFSYLFSWNGVFTMCIIIFLILFDCSILAFFLWHNAGKNKIVDGIHKICKEDMSYKIAEDSLHGDNKILANAVNHIGDSMRSAVEISMKDERLKADLITNVSHDIKTPLTSIINYVDLLKRENIAEEPVKSYISVLDTKSQRLKQLTEDLLEVSKISSGNIILDMKRINITELLKQAVGEFEDKFIEKNLTLVKGYENVPIYIIADSRRTWRVMDNLLNNVIKYAMEGTRVYLDITTKENKVLISLKNISSQALNISADELTERFIRGDIARNTEGSGLGLSIAKNLVFAMDGEFNIYLDGDLFKVTIGFFVD